jgi:tetratricopeptide (TPR) repeat protein
MSNEAKPNNERETKRFIVDVNLVYHCAEEAFALGQYVDALAMYLVLIRSDDSLDAGEVGYRVAQCYERIGDRTSSRFWADRAVAENPSISEYRSYRDRISSDTDVGIVSKYATNYIDKLGISKKLRERALLRGQQVWPPTSEQV